MIFAWGVRFIRLRSSAVRGCASRSARAARSMASELMGLGVLRKVVFLLILRYSACRNEGNSRVAFGVGDEQEDVAFRHADDDKVLLGIIFRVMDRLNSKG